MAKAKKVTATGIRPVRANTTTRIEHPSPTFASIYVNDVNVMMTPWDFRLRVGQIENVDVEKNQAEVTVLADLRISPQHMKKLVQVLTKQLEAYEANLGPIPLPGESQEGS